METCLLKSSAELGKHFMLVTTLCLLDSGDLQTYGKTVPEFLTYLTYKTAKINYDKPSKYHQKACLDA